MTRWLLIGLGAGVALYGVHDLVVGAVVIYREVARIRAEHGFGAVSIGFAEALAVDLLIIGFGITLLVVGLKRRMA